MGYGSSAAIMIVVIAVIITGHRGVAGAVLSTLHSSSRIVFITASEVGDIVVTILQRKMKLGNLVQVTW